VLHCKNKDKITTIGAVVTTINPERSSVQKYS